MDRLEELRQEYEKTVKALAFPFTVAERVQLCERRDAIRGEARAIAGNLNIVELHWLGKE